MQRPGIDSQYRKTEIEVAMKTLLSVLLPATAGNTIHGLKLPVYVFIVLASSALFEAASTFWRLITGNVFAPNSRMPHLAGSLGRPPD